MPVSIGIDPTKAFRQLANLERAIRSELRKAGVNPGPASSQLSKGKRDGARFTGRIRQQVAAAIELTTITLAEEIDYSSPIYSGWLRANWNHIEGSKPPDGITPTPPEVAAWRRPDEGEPLLIDFIEPILDQSVDLDGRKSQYFYNNVEYAEDVALGDFPQVSAKEDWYLSIEQRLGSGKFLKDAIAKVKSSGI